MIIRAFTYISSPARCDWGKGSLARTALPILIAISLVLGVSVAYSILYIYPYTRGAPLQPQETPTATTATVIPEIPLPTYSEGRGAGNLSTASTINITPAAQATAEGLGRAIPPLATPSPVGAGIRSVEITNISAVDGKIYLRIRLTVVGGAVTAENISILEVALTPVPFPYGWNGSSWASGPEEARCLLRVPMPLKILSYSYRVSYEDGRSAQIDLELSVDRRASIFGPYSLSIVLKKGGLYLNIAREVPLGGYRDPPGSPPPEIRERASSCG